MGFLIKWMYRGALFAMVAALLHFCGSPGIYSDDDIPPGTTSSPSSSSLSSPAGAGGR